MPGTTSDNLQLFVSRGTSKALPSNTCVEASLGAPLRLILSNGYLDGLLEGVPRWSTRLPILLNRKNIIAPERIPLVRHPVSRLTDFLQTCHTPKTHNAVDIRCAPLMITTVQETAQRTSATYITNEEAGRRADRENTLMNFEESQKVTEKADRFNGENVESLIS